MKKYLLLMLMALSFTCFFVACGNDDDDEGEVVVVNEDGTTSNRSVFLRIDDNSFYLDYVKYTTRTAVASHLSPYLQLYLGLASVLSKTAVD